MHFDLQFEYLNRISDHSGHTQMWNHVKSVSGAFDAVSYTHLRAHETRHEKIGSKLTFVPTPIQRLAHLKLRPHIHNEPR